MPGSDKTAMTQADHHIMAYRIFKARKGVLVIIDGTETGSGMVLVAGNSRVVATRL